MLVLERPCAAVGRLPGEGAVRRMSGGTGEALGVLLLESQRINGQLNQGSASGKPESSLEMKCLFAMKKQLI